jgi:hypothetical protein
LPNAYVEEGLGGGFWNVVYCLGLVSFRTSFYHRLFPDKLLPLYYDRYTLKRIPTDRFSNLSNSSVIYSFLASASARAFSNININKSFGLFKQTFFFFFFFFFLFFFLLLLFCSH